MQSSVSLVFPVYNEISNVERTIHLALEVLNEICSDYEIILVDDASTDGTAEILKCLIKKEPRLKVVTHSHNRSLGGALKTGFSQATKDLIVYSDADLPFDLYEIKRAVRVLEHLNADIVAAYRHDRTSDPWYRIVYTLGYNLLIRLIYGIRIRDVNFAFKAFRREILKDIPLKSEGLFINPEFLFRAECRGLYICQIGVDYFVRRLGQSTLGTAKVVLRTMRDIISFYFELMAFKRDCLRKVRK